MSASVRFLPWFVAVLLAGGGCRSGPVRVPIEDAVPAGTTEFALDPIPTPREASLEPWLVLLGAVSLDGVDPGEPAAAVFGDLFPHLVTPEEADTRIVLDRLSDAEPESFAIDIRSDGGRTEIRIAGADPAGRHWAAETLRQLITIHQGARHVRLGRIRDRPGFPYRGNKRPRAWEARYRANYTHESGADEPLIALGRVWFVPVLSPGGVLDASEAGLVRARRFFEDGVRQGARLFAIEFDDVGFGLDPESRDRFGSYPYALAYYLGECRRILRGLSPDAALYWLPQTYWTRDPRLSRFAQDLAYAGGLPTDLGLILTGPEIISDSIDADDLAGARRAFGLVRRKALVYDNRGREGDHGPLRGRGAELTSEADAVFGERGEVLNRITRLDYSWNPAAYDPHRSHLLACRELVGAAAAARLSRLVREGAGMTPAERSALHGEILLLLDPADDPPVEPVPYLEKVMRDLEKVMRDPDTVADDPDS